MTNSPPALSIWLGYDSREVLSFAVARHSIKRFDRYIPVRGLVLDQLISTGLYYRKAEKRLNAVGHWQLWDPISEAWMSTEFAISRFLVPELAKSGLALFADSDILVRKNISRVFEYAQGNQHKAVFCVKHEQKIDNEVKKDHQLQQAYSRKNWSSVMLFNCDHPSNKRLTVEMVNTLPGRDLHRFCWLKDEEIGDLPPEWNYLVNHSQLQDTEPAIVHFTEGLPDIPGREDQEFAEEWRSMRPYAVGAL